MNLSKKFAKIVITENNLKSLKKERASINWNKRSKLLLNKECILRRRLLGYYADLSVAFNVKVCNVPSGL